MEWMVGVAIGSVVAIALRRWWLRSGTEARGEGGGPGPASPPILRWLAGGLTLATMVAGVVLAGTVLGGLFAPDTWFRGSHGGVDVGVRVALPDIPRGPVSVPTGEGHVTLLDPDRDTLWLLTAAAAAGLGALVVVLHQLAALFARAAAGRPFAPGNTRRLRIVGLLTVALGIGARPVVDLIAQRAAEDAGSTQVVLGAPALWAGALVLVVPGLVFLGLAEIFRWGEAQSAEQEATV